jgi:translation elongation factor EF-4
MVGVKEKIQDVTGVRKTRSGYVLIEINGQTTASEVTEKLNSAIGQEVEIVPLLNRLTLELKNIDPLTTKEELAEDICRELDIQDPKRVKIRSLRGAQWETQFVIATVPTSNVP